MNSVILLSIICT